MHELDHALNALAARNHRLLTRTAALAAGATDQFIEERVCRGQWAVVHAGVYLVGVGPLTWEESVHAAVLAAGEGAEASHRCATLVWGLTGLRSSPVEINVPFSDHPMPHGVIVHRSRRVEEPSVRNGIVVSGVERTLLELGAVVPPVVVDKALASAVRQGFTTTAKIEMYLTHHAGRGRRGTTTLRETLSYYLDGHRVPGSDGEVAFLRALRAAGIEAPVRQLTIDLPDGSKATVDFAWPPRRKIIEFNGWETHSDSRAHDADTWRDAAIREAGWDLRTFAPFSLRERPEAVARAAARWLRSG
jgi:very-short-patch-repair endonuclease